MTSLSYVTVTGTWAGPVTGTVTFTPSATVYASGVPVAMAGVPVQAQVAGGQLLSLTGGPVRLAANDNAAQVEGLDGFWTWRADPVISGVAEEGWSFFLPSSPASVDLYATARTQLPWSGAAGAPDGGTAAGLSFPFIPDIDGGSAVTGLRPAGRWDGGHAT